MNQYTNSYFNIKIDFPDTWGFRYWGNRKNIPQFPERYQTADDDLPTELATEKELLIAHSKIRRHSLVGTILFAVSFYRPNGFSVQEYRAEFESDFKREFQVTMVNGIEIQVLYIESQGNGFICYAEHYAWKYNENIWLLCGIHSDALDGFEEAKGIIRQLVNV
jgi:hypothetical protein